MSDRFKEFLRKHEVRVEKPQDEWQKIEAKINDRESLLWLLPRRTSMGLATAAALMLVVTLFSTRPNLDSETLSDEEAAAFIESELMNIENSDSTVGSEYLSLLE
jgi:hypothetical protein